MTRRVTAALAIVIIVGVLLMLAWTVERHREHATGGPTDEPASVALRYERA
jgi:hypothetical protein